MTAPDEQGERGLGDPFREMWLDGNMRPPFCSSAHSHNRLTPGVGCRYCWPNTCKWDQAQQARGMDLEPHPPTVHGRHRTPNRVGVLRHLLRLHRHTDQSPSDQEMDGGTGV
jgi:hypothetical protein